MNQYKQRLLFFPKLFIHFLCFEVEPMDRLAEFLQYEIFLAEGRHNSRLFPVLQVKETIKTVARVSTHH